MALYLRRLSFNKRVEDFEITRVTFHLPPEQLRVFLANVLTLNCMQVHDALLKVTNFLKCNSTDLRIGLVWKGGENLEIYQRNEHNQHMPVTR